MERDITPVLEDSEQFCNQILQLRDKFLVVFTVAHIVIAVGVHKQICERRRKTE